MLKGDIDSTSTKNDVDLVLQSTTSDSFERPSIADIDDDSLMDVVLASSTTSGSSVFVIQKDRQMSANIEPKTWQKWRVFTGGNIISPPTVADTDGDSNLEVVFGLSNGTMYLLDNNRVKWAYTVPLKYSSLLSDYYRGAIGYTAVSDIDNDGDPEIIFMDGQSGIYDWPGDLYVLRDTGSTYDVIDTISIGSTGGGFAAPALADIDNDGKQEIVVATYYGLRVFDFDSDTLSQKCTTNHRKLEGAPTLYDIDRDGQYEAVFTSSDFACQVGTCTNEVHIVNASSCTDDDSNAGFTLSLYPRTGPSIANMDSDDTPEIILAAKTVGSGSDHNMRIRVYDAKTDSQQWEYSLTAPTISPNIADIDGKNGYDVVMTTNDTRVIILDKNGNVGQSYTLVGVLGSAPVIGDIDGDGVAELAVKRAGSPLSIVSFLSGNNAKPFLQPLANRTAITGELLSINDSGEILASDLDGDVIVLDYSGPFNSSGSWQTNENDTGSHTVTISATDDGNLSDYQNFELIVFSTNFTRLSLFELNQTTANFTFNQTQNQSLMLRIPAQANVTYTRLKLRGGS